jgi:hypothetical protein
LVFDCALQMSVPVASSQVAVCQQLAVTVEVVVAQAEIYTYNLESLLRIQTHNRDNATNSSKKRKEKNRTEQNRTEQNRTEQQEEQQEERSRASGFFRLCDNRPGCRRRRRRSI